MLSSETNSVQKVRRRWERGAWHCQHSGLSCSSLWDSDSRSQCTQGLLPAEGAEGGGEGRTYFLSQPAWPWGLPGSVFPLSVFSLCVMSDTLTACHPSVLPKGSSGAVDISLSSVLSTESLRYLLWHFLHALRRGLSTCGYRM